MRTAKCNNSSKKDDIELFPGFKPAYEVTQIDWTDYSIDGVTYSETEHTVYESVSVVPGQTCLTSDSACSASKISPVTNYKVGGPSASGDVVRELCAPSVVTSADCIKSKVFIAAGDRS